MRSKLFLKCNISTKNVIVIGDLACRPETRKIQHKIDIYTKYLNLTKSLSKHLYTHV